MKKKYRYLAVLLSFICLFSGCSFPGSDKDDLQDGLSQYYVNEEGTNSEFLIPVTIMDVRTFMLSFAPSF